MSTTSHYEVYGTLPTLTEQEKNDILTSKELPSVSGLDNGKALIVDGGKWTKKAIPSQLPEVTAPTDNGKVLAVVEGVWAKATPETYTLPEATAETLGGVHQAANVAESSATSVADLKGTVNSLLSALKAAGIMTPDAEEPAQEPAET